MFADWVKMGVKAALIAVITIAIIALLNIVQVPSLNFSFISGYLNLAYTFMIHWFPATIVLWPIVLALVALEIAIMGFKVGAIAWKWIFKINE